MVEPASDPLSAPNAPRCPWCSAELPASDVKTCPTCQANLTAESEAQLPGLTALDLERLAFRRATAPKKSRLMSWISGDSDYENATDPVAQPGSLDLPPFEVRREMLRLEMAARIADLTAEAGALAADQAAANGSDPVAAAAAIQAEIDAATRAEQILADVDAAPASVEPSTVVASPVEPSTAVASPVDVVEESAERPPRTRRLGRRLRPAKPTTPTTSAEPTDPTGIAEATPSDTPGPETAPS
jgi:hypothetical protein